MRKKYNHRIIEKKWQKYWADHQTFKAQIDPKKPKYYILDMFPYPSGAGLHVGHVTGYTGTDILARYMRQKGYNVLHPMGWDSFGLPAEQYAMRTGTHPRITTKKNIDTYRKQLQSLGFSYDWDREMATSDPEYYKWTQWIFTKLYEKNLAYEAELLVNYCPDLGTVLANEEVENGFSKEGGYPVIRKPLRQWVLKITAYAERLLEDLEELDWPENLKKLQRNWIGKSEGAAIDFIEATTSEKITVFTTRPDTLFGATYLVLSPEHPLVSKITSLEQKEAVEKYQKTSSTKSDLERTDLVKEKTGEWTGAFALHPISGEKIPIWISDYVLMGYGTGAIMAVPAHDERDFDFAKKFSIVIRPVYDPDPALLQEEFFDDAKMVREQILNGKKCWEKAGKVINSTNRDFSLNGLSIGEAKDKMIAYLEEKHLGKGTTSYKLRDWLFSRQRYWGEPIPILHFDDGTARPLDLDELPLIPPNIEDFHPGKGGESPLANVRDWVEIVDKKTGKKAHREINTMPQWAGSCWYYLRFLDPHNCQEAWNLEKERYWMPVDLYVGGAEHAVLHLLYARFWHKVLYDLQLVHTKEPFQTYRYQGIVTAPSYKLESGAYIPFEEVEEKEGNFIQTSTQKKVLKQLEKMSKSKLNGVTPDEIVHEFGADALRLYEMFMGPFDKEKIWNTDAVHGCYRFLYRFYDMSHSEKVTDVDTEEALRLGHRLVNGVTHDIETMQFNTAIAKLMEFINAFTALDQYPKTVIKMAVQMLYPLAPHIAEELWEDLGEKSSIAYRALPVVDEKMLIDETVTFVIQVNGKFRGKCEKPRGALKEDILLYAKEHPAIAKHLQGEMVKIIFVPDKLLNIVMK
ncbi:MAG: leucine--tRNA ligase [Parachlamydiales bacterium]|nr:leucine--tRNA ligase [Parachlamydiales bacterium]